MFLSRNLIYEFPTDDLKTKRCKDVYYYLRNLNLYESEIQGLGFIRRSFSYDFGFIGFDISEIGKLSYPRLKINYSVLKDKNQKEFLEMIGQEDFPDNDNPSGIPDTSKDEDYRGLEALVKIEEMIKIQARFFNSNIT